MSRIRFPCKFLPPCYDVIMASSWGSNPLGQRIVQVEQAVQSRNFSREALFSIHHCYLKRPTSTPAGSCQ